MYTNELLEEKYKAQRQLFKKAKVEKKDYFEIVTMEIQDLFKYNGWNMQFDKKRGAFWVLKYHHLLTKFSLNKCLIGIGTPITERPSHTTWHTDRVPRRFG
jgi:hypothetical protein